MGDHCEPSADELMDDVLSLAGRRRRFQRRINRKLEDLQQELFMAGRTGQELLDLLREADTVDEGLVRLLRELKVKVDAAKGNQAAIDQAFTEVQADMATKAQAILENTDSEPEPTPPGGQP